MKKAKSIQYVGLMIALLLGVLFAWGKNLYQSGSDTSGEAQSNFGFNELIQAIREVGTVMEQRMGIATSPAGQTNQAFTQEFTNQQTNGHLTDAQIDYLEQKLFERVAPTE